MQSEECTGHSVQVEHCRSSDTVSVLIDGKTELVLGDDGFEALIKACNWKEWNAASRQESVVVMDPHAL